jgi:hypothetical protein
MLVKFPSLVYSVFAITGNFFYNDCLYWAFGAYIWTYAFFFWDYSGAPQNETETKIVFAKILLVLGFGLAIYFYRSMKKRDWNVWSMERNQEMSISFVVTLIATYLTTWFLDETIWITATLPMRVAASWAVQMAICLVFYYYVTKKIFEYEACMKKPEGDEEYSENGDDVIDNGEKCQMCGREYPNYKNTPKCCYGFENTTDCYYYCIKWAASYTVVNIVYLIPHFLAISYSGWMDFQIGLAGWGAWCLLAYVSSVWRT